MDIKNLKPKAKESVFLYSDAENKARFLFGDIDTVRVVETGIQYCDCPIELSLTYFKKLLPMLEFVDVNMITINDKHDTAFFHSGDKQFSCMCFNRSIDFIEGWETSAKFLPKDLIKIIKDIGLNCSTEIQRAFLTGIYFSENGDIVGCDSKRLSLKKTPFKFDNLIVRPEAFQFSGKKDVYYTLKEIVRDGTPYTYIKLTDGDTCVITEAVHGTYPNYERVIPDFDNLEKVFCKGFSTFKKQEKAYKVCKSNRVILSNEDIIVPPTDETPEMKIGLLSGFNKDGVNFNGEFLKDIFTQFGDSMDVYCPIITTVDGQTPYGKMKAHIFGNLNDYFSVVMPLSC